MTTTITTDENNNDNEEEEEEDDVYVDMKQVFATENSKNKRNSLAYRNK